MSDLPIACSLSEAELRDRERTLLAELRRYVRSVEPHSSGLVLHLADADAALAAAAAVIAAERRCCPFLHFALVSKPGMASVSLTLSGPPGTREFLAEWFPALAVPESP